MFKKFKTISKRQEYRNAERALQAELHSAEATFSLNRGLNNNDIMNSPSFSKDLICSENIFMNSTESTTNQNIRENTMHVTDQNNSDSDSDSLELRSSDSDNPENDENVEILQESSQQSSSDFLRNWSFQNNITHTALTQLLTWFSTKPELSSLPLCAKTLLSTPPKLVLEQHPTGLFYYFGLSKTLTEIVVKDSSSITEFCLSFGIDGIPLYKSSSVSFWPIMCKIINLRQYPVFAVAIFSGSGKPELHAYLQKFVAELSELQSNGLFVEDRYIKIIIHSFCCDYPAKCFIKNTKGHNGYGGCDKCTDRGKSGRGRMMFLSSDAPKRTDSSFRERVDTFHHKDGTSPLTLLKIDMVMNFPIDYMHSVCLGIVRKLLFLWRDDSPLYRIRGDNLVAFESHIENVKRFWPSEFSRKPRSLHCLERWKATELRQFLLYIGPVILKNILPKQFYSNFLILHFALTVLLNGHLNSKFNDFASSLLKIFVTHAVSLYGEEFCIYNTHSLIHLADDAKHFDSLNDINCFEFENYLQALKKSVRGYNLPLQQAINRIYEWHSHDFEKKKSKQNLNVYCKKPCKNKNNNLINYQDSNFFEELVFKDTIFTNNIGNNMILFKNGDIAEAHFFCMKQDEIYILGKKYEALEPLYDYPESSCVLNISKVCISSEENLNEYKTSDILCKGIIIPADKKYFVVEFPKEEERGQLPMAVVPSNWVRQEKGETTCMWPNNIPGGNRGLKNAVQLMQDISSFDYLLCPVHIKYGSNSFMKANDKLKYLENREKGNDTVTTEFSSDEILDTPKIIKDKRNTYKNKKFRDYIMSLSSDEDELPVIPKLSSVVGESSHTSTPTEKTHNAKRYEQPPTEESRNGNAEELTTFLALCKRISTMESVINKMYKKICILTNKIETLTEKCDQKLENDNQALTIWTKETLNCLKEFPTQEIAKLQELEKSLDNDELFGNVSTYFTRIGGRSAFELIRNILNSLISHQLALNMNWSGRNEKESFRYFTNIVKVITVVARQAPKGQDITQMEVENVIKVWLRTAGDRSGGRDKRRRSKSSPPVLSD